MTNEITANEMALLKDYAVSASDKSQSAEVQGMRLTNFRWHANPAIVLALIAKVESLAADAERQFFGGVIAALGALAPHHQHGDVVHNEIVRSVGKEALYRAAEPEDIAWAALDPEYYATMAKEKT